MLQNLRDNLKGTVAIFVIIIFVVPLVLFGVEQLFVSSVGGTGAATVNGEEVSQRELQRELVLEKQRRQQRFNLDANSPQLEDSVLIGPVLKRMVKRLAIQQAAIDGGMGASKDVLWKQIAEIEAFQTDGKLDYELFKERISYLYTPSSFLDASADDLLLGDVNAGISNSSFVTAQEVKLLASITKQKRTFFSVKIPKESLGDIVVSAEEVSDYYNKNPKNYMSPESVTVDYVELNLDALANDVNVSEADVRAAYEVEVKDFVPDPKYKVAHILLKSEKGRKDKIQEISTKLAEDADFSELAKVYSEDLGSKAGGGNLGEMIADAYPKAFVEAVNALSVGGVSGAVKTEAGIHFIKLVEKLNVEAPSFEERKSALARQISRDLAQLGFAQKMEVLGDTTFNSDSLLKAAEALSLEVKTSLPFGRNETTAISSSLEVAKTAFADDVLLEGHNSRVIELPGDKAVVLRVKSHEPESIKPLALVKFEIQAQLKIQKQNEQLAEKSSALLARISSASDAESLAKEFSYEYKLNEKADRAALNLGSSIIRKVFSLPRPFDSGSPVIDSVQTQDGGYAVVGLLAVENGSLSDMDEGQADAMKDQLSYQLNQLEMSAFESAVFTRSEISMPD